MRITEGQLYAFAADILQAAGLGKQDAETVAQTLVDADLSGIPTHGVSRMGIYVKRLEEGVVDRTASPCVIEEHPSALVVDACNAMGAVGATFAMEKCIEKAAETGSCWAAVRNSNHFGAAGYFARMAAEKGMVGIAMTNLTSKIAPWGSSQGYMGTNPIAIAVPTGADPLVLDMTPSVVSLGKLILAQKLGESIPEGWALDADGNPTTDPKEGRAGTLLPIGGPKGSGLAIMVDVLCGLLSDGPCGPHIRDLYGEYRLPQQVGHMFCAIDISAFLPLARFSERADTMVQEIKSLPKVAGTEEILMPGERSAACRHRNTKDGIDLADAVWEELCAIAARYGVKLPIEEEEK